MSANTPTDDGMEKQHQENRGFDKKLVAHQERISALHEKINEQSLAFDKEIKGKSDDIKELKKRVCTLENFKSFSIGIAVAVGFFGQILIKMLIDVFGK